MLFGALWSRPYTNNSFPYLTESYDSLSKEDKELVIETFNIHYKKYKAAKDSFLNSIWVILYDFCFTLNLYLIYYHSHMIFPKYLEFLYFTANYGQWTIKSFTIGLNNFPVRDKSTTRHQLSMKISLTLENLTIFNRKKT